MGLLPVPVPSKDVVREIESGGKWAFGFLQRLLRLSETQAKHTGLIDKQAADIKALTSDVVELRRTIERLQDREDLILARAEAASTRAAAQMMADLARRIGSIEATIRA